MPADLVDRRLVFAACSALRLARFNTMLEDLNAPKWTKGYFTGVPRSRLAQGLLFCLCSDPSIWRFLATRRAVACRLVDFCRRFDGQPPANLGDERPSCRAVFVAPIMAAVLLDRRGLFTKDLADFVFLGTAYFLMLPYGYWRYRRREKRKQEGKTE